MRIALQLTNTTDHWQQLNTTLNTNNSKYDMTLIISALNARA